MIEALRSSAESLVELSENHGNLMLQREEAIKGLRLNKGYSRSVKEVEERIRVTEGYIHALLERIDGLIEKERENV